MMTSTMNQSFQRVPDSTPIEEEQLPGYVAEDCYPIAIGEVLDSRYREVCKLGRGVGSTVWLAKDVCNSQYQVLKVCTHTSDGMAPQQADHEIAVSQHLKTAPVQQHPGKLGVRTVLDSFPLCGPYGQHMCILYSPLGMTFTELRNLLPGRKFEKRMLQHGIQFLLLAIDYLHKNSVVHTDIPPNNILIGVSDDSVFSQLEQDELASPVARKVLPDRTVYLSRPMPRTNGNLVLCDLGSARMGRDKYQGDIMPDVYRSPEVILGMEWSSKVDIWSVGVMIWDLLEGRRLFNAKRDGILNDEQHVAEMVSLMGKPPREFVQRSDRASAFFDDSGNWIGSIPIPNQPLEDRIDQLHGEDKQLLLGFVRRIPRWLPKERPTAEELAYDDFLMQAYFASQSQPG
ncbi:Serine/threonine-protein kinase SRPK [Tolypocladium ophioglossoides CBS 100239]|uniref:Serine/threonine-protein kinase SRPK n=1 Tax=Tolypocladium ophioglossoides (strain CBS 100239) TaxID=1163406 RepID=A0A0L0N3S5_TOLOC|nr:Serine/threonine-protein kinase SRPK [Tolypocladium ophioglossoides CBS 100239]